MTDLGFVELALTPEEGLGTFIPQIQRTRSELLIRSVRAGNGKTVKFPLPPEGRFLQGLILAQNGASFFAGFSNDLDKLEEAELGTSVLPSVWTILQVSSSSECPGKWQTVHVSTSTYGKLGPKYPFFRPL